jgi:hypothetical protein
MRDREHIDGVLAIYVNEPRYLLGLDYDQCLTVAQQLWDTNRIIQPRAQGLRRHSQPANSVWVDIFPTELSQNQSVKKAWNSYRLMLQMVENVDNQATDVFKV